MRSWRGAAIGLAVAAAAVPAGAAPPAGTGNPRDWTEPVSPFRIVGDIYYVGSKGLAAYLIASPGGPVLIDGTLSENVPMIERNIAALGFRLRDIRVLLNNHAHFDHAAGLARLKRDSGARLLASAGDRAALESGRPRSHTTYGMVAFPPVRVDAVVGDGQAVRAGGVRLVAVPTPGHTPGCTTWTTTAIERGRRLRVVFPCSLTVAGNVLRGNAGYPAIAGDFRRSFRRMAMLRADVVLPAHPELVDLLGREHLRAAGDTRAFEMPGLLAAITARAAGEFERACAAPVATAANGL